MTTSPYLTDAEVDDICAGLTQNAAKVRHLRAQGLVVSRKPNGRPLVWRPQAHVQAPGQPAGAHAPAPGAAPGINVTGLQDWAARRKAKARPSSNQ